MTHTVSGKLYFSTAKSGRMLLKSERQSRNTTKYVSSNVMNEKSFRSICFSRDFTAIPGKVVYISRLFRCYGLSSFLSFVIKINISRSNSVIFIENIR